MDLWILFNGKNIKVSGETYDNLPIEGKITNVVYLPNIRNGNEVVLTVDNGTEKRVPVKRGKPILDNSIYIN
jgi:hypothetical protein